MQITIGKICVFNHFSVHLRWKYPDQPENKFMWHTILQLINLQWLGSYEGNSLLSSYHVSSTEAKSWQPQI